MNNGTRRVFTEPVSLAAARALRKEVIEEIEIIELQLGDRNKKHADGSLWTDEEFATWRSKALTAHRARVKMLRNLNEWITAASGGA